MKSITLVNHYYDGSCFHRPKYGEHRTDQMCFQERTPDQLDCSLIYASYTCVWARHKLQSICLFTCISYLSLELSIRRKNCVCLQNSSLLHSYPPSFHEHFVPQLGGAITHLFCLVSRAE